MVHEIEGDVEGSLAWSIGRDPVLLVFSVCNLAWRDGAATLAGEQGLADGRSDEIALKLCKLDSNLIKLR